MGGGVGASDPLEGVQGKQQVPQTTHSVTLTCEQQVIASAGGGVLQGGDANCGSGGVVAPRRRVASLLSANP